MANNVAVASNGRRVFQKILVALGQRNVTDWNKRVWVCTGAAPAVEAGTYTSAVSPVQVGDLALRSDGSVPYICTIAPISGTAATFVKLVP